MNEQPSSSNADRLLAGFSARLSHDSHYMANLLSTYKRYERVSNEDVAKLLDTSPAAIVRLSLCRRPNSGSKDFGEQVKQLSVYANADVVRLANLNRQVEGLEALKFESHPEVKNELAPRGSTAEIGRLVAARDRQETTNSKDSRAKEVKRKPDANDS